MAKITLKCKPDMMRGREQRAIQRSPSRVALVKERPVYEAALYQHRVWCERHGREDRCYRRLMG